MRKTVAAIGLVAATLVLTGCGEDKPKPVPPCGKLCEPPSAKDRAWAQEHDWISDWFNVRMVDVWSPDLGANYYNDLSDSFKEKMGKVAWTICRSDWKNDQAAEDYAIKKLGVNETNAYRIRYQATWGEPLSCYNDASE